MLGTTQYVLLGILW